MSRTPYSKNTYVGGANAAVLSGSITNTATTISISGTTNSWGTLGSTGGFTVAINYGTAIEEKVYIPSGSYTWGSGVVTISGVQRGYDDTTAAGQSDGFSVVHVLAATDLQEANNLVNNILGLPGNNTAVGSDALSFNTTESANTAVGAFALQYNTGGFYNTALGYASLTTNTSGYYNTAVGVQTLYENITGDYNIAVGVSSLQNNSTGTSNVAVGVFAATNNVNGYNNIAIGYAAVQDNTVGFNNVGIGNYALSSVISGYGNTAVGSFTFDNSDGIYNTALGYSANTVGSGNVAIGVDHTGGTVVVSGLDQIVLGTSLHSTTIPGTLVVSGTVSLSTPLGVVGGGTGSTTASGALANLGALPLAGGTMTGPLTLTDGLITQSNGSFTDSDTLIMSYMGAF